MKKERNLWYLSVCIALLLLIFPNVNANWEEYKVLNQDFLIEDNPPRNQWYPWIEYNSVDDEFMIIWSSSGPWEGDTTDHRAMEGQRVSTDGALLGDTISLIAPNTGYQNGARFAYNNFTNEYLLANPKSPTPNSRESEILIARIDNMGNILYGLESLMPSGGGESLLPVVVFNSERREYLVAYDDRNFVNPFNNKIGFILNEDGTPKHGPFEIGNQEGDFYASRGVYNPTNDTYFIVWEDFRNVADWMEPCDIYGALLDGDGNMIMEIPIVDDFALGEPDAGDQRVPVPEYNPDKDEFFVIYEVDEKPTVDDSAIMGIFIAPDGTLKGEPFTIVDEPRQQHWPVAKYIPEEKKYFLIWNDCRNDGMPAGTDWFQSPAIDVYGRWMDDDGSLLGEEILIAEREGTGESWKQCPVMAYSPVKNRILITWYNRMAIGGDTPFSDAPADTRATLFGVPDTTTSTTSIVSTTTTVTGCPSSNIYGEGSEEVKLLRDIRDNILDKSPEGKALIELYYQLGPVVVKMMEDNEELKETVKGMIDTILY